MSKVDSVLKFKKLSLTAPCPTDRGKMSSFGVGTYMNNPRFVFSAGDTKLMNKEMSFGRVEAAMAPGDFYACLEIIRLAVAAPGEYKVKVETFGKGPGAGFKDPPVLMADLWVGKDKDGVVSISLISKKDGFPTVVFPFGPTDGRFTKFHESGSQFTKAHLSCVYAKGWCEMVSQLMAQVLKQDYVPPEPWNPNGGQGGGGNRGGAGYANNANGGGGGYQNNRNNSGGGGGYNNNNQAGSSKPAVQDGMDDLDDDIPF